jgi:dCMP deaminase
MAERLSQESKDRSTKVGAVIVRDGVLLTSGWNGFPRKINDDIDERHERPTKYSWVIHAEMNAILNHARVGGTSLEGSTLYLNYRPGVCSNCMGALIQVGVIAVVGPTRPFPGQGNGTSYCTSISEQMMLEAGVTHHIIDYDIDK